MVLFEEGFRDGNWEEHFEYSDRIGGMLMAAINLERYRKNSKRKDSNKFAVFNILFEVLTVPLKVKLRNVESGIKNKRRSRHH